MGLSHYALTSMGFRLLTDNDSVTGYFHKLYVFEARGLAIGEAVLTPMTGSVQNQQYQVGFGDNVNEICQLLINDTFVENEPQWREDKKTSAPFVVIHLGPTKLHRCTSGHVKEEKRGDHDLRLLSLSAFGNQGR